MRSIVFPVLFALVTMSQTIAGTPNNLDLEAWFDPKKRDHIDELHQFLMDMNVEALTGYDFTTVWRVSPFKAEVKGRKIIWVLSTTRKDGVGCCYFPAGGLIFEVRAGDSAAKFAQDLSCDADDDEIALDWMVMEGDSQKGKKYSAINCVKD